MMDFLPPDKLEITVLGGLNGSALNPLTLIIDESCLELYINEKVCLD